MQPYDHLKIEKKWQDEWASKKLYETDEKKGLKEKKPKFYVLDMFPYPSGEGLHVGHPKGYIATDIVSRMKRMQGHEVLHPMGFDAFGLPAENYAIKTKTNPMDSVATNVARYKKQLEILGFDYDWSREVNTTDPAFYKWTQWIFLKLLEEGLAYESYEPINWCPKDKTGLANEDVEDGKCERCGTPVEKKLMRQWVLRITDYADRMLRDLDAKDENGNRLMQWPESIMEAQRNWIGRSEGMIFTAPVKEMDFNIQTFSAHFEACYADTFVVIAPDHTLLPKLLEGVANKQEILDFCKKILDRRVAAGREEETESEGIFTGRYIVDPLGNGDLPIWVASFALADYGTGIVKCSAHDERDFKFAKKYGIAMKTVLYPEDATLAEKVKNQEICFVDMKKGILTEPKEFAGKVGGSVRQEIANFLVSNKLAERKTTYKLRPWVFSRQRYWGEPIPVIHCEACGIVPVPEKDLPVTLPKVEFYEPTGTGESPLAAIHEWVNVKCPKCDAPAKRETNTMPQWAGSSWYYLRYMDPTNTKALVSPEKERYWAPVDFYVGGAEHATRHLIYARFWHKFLYDIGVVSTIEPFKKLQHVGLIMAEDGRKMSKRYGNVVNPDDIVKNIGADSMRVYEMFMGPFDQSIGWNTNNAVGARRFIERVWRLGEKVMAQNDGATTAANPKIEATIHKTIKKVSDDIAEMRFNTAISTMMITVNELETAGSVAREHYSVLLRLLAPFAPHITEELWREVLGNKESIHISEWPVYDPAKAVDATVRIIVQVNGKVRTTFEADAAATEADIQATALALDETKKWIEGKEIKKIIVVKGRLVNVVI
jgi:leucyl-tRNA synthetase